MTCHWECRQETQPLMATQMAMATEMAMTCHWECRQETQPLMATQMAMATEMAMTCHWECRQETQPLMAILLESFVQSAKLDLHCRWKICS